MTSLHYIILLGLLFSFSGCGDDPNEPAVDARTKSIPSDLKVDHFNIWVKNPTIAKQRLTDIGFTCVPDSLSEIHKGQGTTGRYFYFLNSYLELIFVYDQEELEENNRKNKDLDFTKRADFENNGASPFSVGLQVKDYNADKIPFEKVDYHQDWMEENAFIYSAKNSKTHLKEPSIFVVYPEIETKNFESISDLKEIPDEYAFVREFYKHPNGAEKVTDIVITSINIEVDTKTIKALNGIENVTVKNGAEHLMEIYFDDNFQGKSFDLRPELPLIVYL